MQHVWLATQPHQNGSLRVWVAAQKMWQWLSDWQALRAFNLENNISNQKVCLYIPTQSVLSIESELSSHQLKQLGTSGQQYLFEDISLTSVEQLRVKVLSATNQHYLYAVAISQIEQWQQSAGLADFVVQVIVPDFVLLPTPEVREGSQVVIYHDNDTTLLRTAMNVGMAVSYMPLLAAQLEALPILDELTLMTTVDNQAFISQVQNLSVDSIIDSQSIAKQVAETNQTTQLDSTELDARDSNNTIKQSIDLVDILQNTSALIHLSTDVLMPLDNPERHPLNMVERQRQHVLSPYLKVAIFVALFAGILQMSADALQWYQYQQAAVATQEATAEQYAYWFNNEPLNTRTTLMAQVQPRLLPSQSADTSQLGMLSRIAPLIKQSNMVAQALSWDDAAIRLTLMSERRDGLDELVSTLAEQGIRANLGSVSPQGDDGVIGELTVPLVSAQSSESSPTT